VDRLLQLSFLQPRDPAEQPPRNLVVTFLSATCSLCSAGLTGFYAKCEMMRYG
jgi:hypothetical protein